ncbi:MAG: hypothetical protein M3395_10560, partial [Chloroflexota bacterium]|nr:hypothetical protein [Chloroflexota bacterium]
MPARIKGALTFLTAATLLVTACAAPAASSAPTQAAATTAPTDAGTSAAPTDAGTSAAPTDDWPLTGTLKDGSTFTLHPRVAEKLAEGEPINYVFSYGSTAIPL